MQPIFPETTLDKSVVLFYNKCKNPGAAAAAGNAVFRLKEYMRGFMYTYFIADDETKIRQGLRRLIDWEELGFFAWAKLQTGRTPLRSSWKKTGYRFAGYPYAAAERP